MLQHLLEFNDRRDLSLEDREMVLEDLVLLILCFVSSKFIEFTSSFKSLVSLGKGDHIVMADR